MWLYRLADRMRQRRRLRSGNRAHAWGKRGEDLAHRHLQSVGHIVVARNYRTRGGTAEVDLVTHDGDTVVFVEVKTRGTDRFGAPEEAVDQEKRRRIVRGARHYLTHAGEDTERIRFDIVTVLFGEKERIEHIRDAFAPDGLSGTTATGAAAALGSL
jgi:putative endonuclease